MLSSTVANQWGNIYLTVCHNMEERWEQNRAQIENLHCRGLFTEPFDVAKPWGAVMSYSAYGSGQDGPWWHTHLELPCLTGGTASGAGKKIAELFNEMQQLELEPNVITYPAKIRRSVHVEGAGRQKGPCSFSICSSRDSCPVGSPPTH